MPLPKAQSLDAWKLGMLLRNERELMGLTQIQASEALGIGKTPIQMMEAGKYLPSLQNFWQICKFYTLDPEWVLEQASKPERATKARK
jgi:transcriptional regulator with XRE-family HTH domain